MDGIAVAELDRRSDPVGADPCAVLATEILEHCALGRHDKSRVPPRDGGRIQSHFDSSIASDDVLADREREALASPFEPADRPGRLELLAALQCDGLATKRIPKAMQGSNPLRRARGVSQRAAELGDKIREVGLDHERVGPQTLLQYRFRDRVRTFGSQRHKQLEGLRREPNFIVVTGQPPSV